MDEGTPPFQSSAHRWAWGRRVLIALGASLAVLTEGGLLVWELSPRPTDLAARVRRQDSAAGAAPVPLSAVAPVMRDAVVATEDERFYRHHGVDLLGVIRAAAFDVSHFSLAQGASTITEQLAKGLYLNGNDHSAWRKVEDAALAIRIEGLASKEQILQDYLNTVYFGQQAYGVDAASTMYFGVDPRHLDLAQASLLAGLIQSPSTFDPFTNPSGARLRQADVLRSMVRNGLITTSEGRTALATPLPLANGRILPALIGVAVVPGRAFSSVDLGLGALLLVASIGLWLLSAGAVRRPAVARLAPVALGAAAMVVLARSIQVA